MLNYKHLHYFWVAAKQGGVVRASERLHITPQTISGQIRLLEEHFGGALFQKVGRKLELTDVGRMVLSYADEIFSLGDELEDAMRSNSFKRPQPLRVGVADVVPKSIAYRLLAPALQLADPIRMICKENSLSDLLAELALHRLDIVIADAPVPAGIGIRGFNHALGECGLSFVAVPKLASELRNNFPSSLNGAPLLIPSEISVTHMRLQQWFDKQHIYPNVVGEFDDSALMKAFGQAGVGVFVVPTAIANEIIAQYGVELVGATDEISEQFFAISTERRLSNPAVIAITETAREWLD
ncbi:transcriptional activator NhaR [Corallincola holothuriorum]|uniref:Transcriptional activator NhaR n=1 Tax=Corallincola holothuriorum TaxID=2282215 RepID=A0A368NJT4_9GAMM|nr:transcriptional activator NhaR [Corallincola holothuriorum]RCU50867.1 transcriptional activator NhaR [Corallincola holothuriorum]